MGDIARETCEGRKAQQAAVNFKLPTTLQRIRQTTFGILRQTIYHRVHFSPLGSLQNPSPFLSNTSIISRSVDIVIQTSGIQPFSVPRQSFVDISLSAYNCESPQWIVTSQSAQT